MSEDVKIKKEPQFVLTWPWSENIPMQMWLFEKVAYVNQLLDQIYEEERCANLDEKSHPFFLNFGGIYYQVIKVFSGVIKKHINSEGMCTFQCMQIPSSDMDYYFEVSEEFFRNHIKVLEGIVRE